MNTSTNNDSNEDLSKNDIDFINRLAKKIHSSGFVTPCVLFLEMGRPISSLGSHARVFLGPFINGLVQSDGYYRAAELLNNKEIIAILLDEIERLEMLDSADDNRSNN